MDAAVPDPVREHGAREATGGLANAGDELDVVVLEDLAATVYAAAGPFVPKGDSVNGVSVITMPDIRWARCDIKSVNLLPNCLASQRARESGALEAIFVLVLGVTIFREGTINARIVLAVVLVVAGAVAVSAR